MTGVGKTTVGRVLAGLLGCEFVDADAEIERRVGLSVAEIFVQQGEAAFRAEETRVIREIGTRKHAVVVLGAGALESMESREIIAQNGKLVYLRAPLDLIIARCENTTDRPMLTGLRTRMELEERLRAMLNSRETQYASADLTIDIAAEDLPRDVVKRIIAELK
jgi:shikimate kinase